METSDAIFKRRSIKKYKQNPIEEEKIGMIIEAAKFAPSSGNLQNWQFILVKDPAKRLKIAELCNNQMWMAQAPLHIVICAEQSRMQRMFGETGEKFYSIQNCACAAENMMLCATDLGLGSCFVSAFDYAPLAELLDVPESASIQVVLTIGIPDENPGAPIRYQVPELCFFESYGNRLENPDKDFGEYGAQARSAVEKAMGAVDKYNDKVEKESKGIFDKIKEHLNWK